MYHLRMLLLFSGYALVLQLMQLLVTGRLFLPASKTYGAFLVQRLPAGLVWDIVLYIAVILVLHVGIAFNAWFCARQYSRASLVGDESNARALGYFVFILIWLLLLLWNTAISPRSVFSLGYLADHVSYLAGLIWLVVLMLGVFELAAFVIWIRFRAPRAGLGMALLLVGGM
ncbi:MAG: hypothetical protein C3L25_00360 [Candidatus Sedimenticola endophacoides]|uniref:Uncharacterized protein n=1 Tax=Candidatus Sedimenticola endophacoides TaxID=2548426 RepID=A0A6N4DL93_9GAMM|nr:MAG: hypothetical protein C3L24_08850 [Candidatus Sedimenticola endophacoides]PUE03674.1 MAG: hypothetical protein C3L26_00370 [Candidatus Sedimenticola endophacoides]PUE05582.1 MAG: hypothetical protein C3L25_00360 [Candidatus Sedimenticola endophacoides]